MSLYFDHLVLNVNDLDQATRDFEDAGFRVLPGGTHGGGLSKNAIISFQDDSFIELFALTNSWKVKLLRIFKGLKFLKRYQYSKKWGLPYRFYSRSIELKPGIIDICFLSDNYEADHQRINDDGLFLTKTIKGRRKKTTGSFVKWKMASPFINELPFIRSAYEPPKELSKEDVEHANGVTGIDKVLVAALDYKDMTSKYATFLGVDPLSTENQNGHRTSFKLKNTIVEVLKSSEHKEIQERIRGKGMSMYGVSFKRDDLVKDPISDEKLSGLTII